MRFYVAGHLGASMINQVMLRILLKPYCHPKSSFNKPALMRYLYGCVCTLRSDLLFMRVERDRRQWGKRTRLVSHIAHIIAHFNNGISIRQTQESQPFFSDWLLLHLESMFSIFVCLLLCCLHILYMVALPSEFVILKCVSVFSVVYSPDMEKCKRLRVVAVVKCWVEQKLESGLTLQRHQRTIYQHFGKCSVTFCYYQQDVQVRD